jgi:hypothetical protein
MRVYLSFSKRMSEDEGERLKIRSKIGRLDPGLINVSVLEKSLNDTRAASLGASVFSFIATFLLVCSVIARGKLGTSGADHALVIGILVSAISCISCVSIVLAFFPLKGAIQMALVHAGPAAEREQADHIEEPQRRVNPSRKAKKTE